MPDHGAASINTSPPAPSSRVPTSPQSSPSISPTEDTLLASSPSSSSTARSPSTTAATTSTWTKMFSIPFSVLTLGALYSSLFVLADPLVISGYQVSEPLRGILEGSANGTGSDRELYRYPTDLTRGIVPKPLHSHNDYWRDKPFWSALSVGAISVEADVWLYNGTLHVGHEESALTPTRTFKSLYIDPIMSVLSRENPSSPFVTDGPTSNGVFDTDSSQTLYLWIDMKTSGEATYPFVHRALQPLRSAGYLSTYNATSDTYTSGAVTAIGTGNTPEALVRAEAPLRDLFFDASIPDIANNTSNVTANMSPIASTDFAAVFPDLARNGSFSAAEMDTLQSQIRAASDRGIGCRYWDTPAFPVSARNRIWTTLYEAGVALVNVDDLEAGAGLGDGGASW